MDEGEVSQNAIQPAYLFTELTSLDELSFPASSSKRIKFTCVCASPRHLVLGTSSGTVYVFSRFRVKGRGTALPPVEIFTTKDGSVNKILVSPDEQNVAVGSDSGRVSVAALATNGLATALIYTSPGDARRTDKVTGLCWSKDSKIVFASHMSGAVIAHQLMQSVFRVSAKTIYTMDSEIVQLEMNESGKQLLVSSLTASFVYDLDSRTSSQVGKKTRNSRMGACFVHSEKEFCEFIAASRPNGRLWEANNVGVVYRTHQFRLSSYVPRYSIASFRSSFKGSQRLADPTEQLETAVNEDVQLFLLQTIRVSGQTFLISSYGSKLLVFDTETSQVILITDLGKEILQFCVCASDVFVILNTSSNSTAPAKLTLLPTEKAVEKLQLRSCHSQAAEIVTKTSGIKWDIGLVKALLEGLNNSKKKERNTETLKSALEKMLSQMEINESTYDNQIRAEVSKKLPSGVHQVLCQPSVSGLEDDFSFRFTSPMRERSQSSPTVDIRQSLSPNLLMKQNSVPLTAEEVESCSRNGTPDVTEQDILERARTILESDGHVIEADSLRTLLQFESPDMRFTPQVTVANAAKALAELALITPLDVSVILTVDRRVNASGTKRTGPTIVKPVMRQVSRPAAAAAPLSPPKSPMERNSNIIQEITSNSAEKIIFSDEENNVDLGDEWLERRMSEVKEVENGEEKCQNSVPSTSSESESIATTESGKDVKLENREDTDLCRHCGMHRSWLGLSLLATVCKRVQIDKSTKESVPNSSTAWSQLLTRRIRNSSLESRICPRCESAFASVGKTLANLPRSSGLTPKEYKIDTNAIRERIKETGRSRMETICCGTPSQSKVTSPDALSPSLSAVSTVSKNSLSSPSPITFSPSEMSPPLLADNDLPWLNRVEINTLLFFCCLVLGYRGLLSLLKDSAELAELLAPNNWATLVSLAIREQQFKRDFVSPQVVKDVLEPLRLSQFISIPAAEKSPSPRASISRRVAPPPVYSWIIDSTGSCLICTLPLQTQVKGEDLMVTSFQCSHTYHSKCLAGKSYCVACRIRARKMVTVSSGPIRQPPPRTIKK